MGQIIHCARNASVLLYHYVFPAKYRQRIFDPRIDEVLIQTCQEISNCYDINFLEIGTDGDHVHFLIQTVATMAPAEIAQTIKSITAKEIYRLCPWVKEQLWGGKIWGAGYFVSTVGQHDNEKQIKKYVRSQGKNYYRMYRGQLRLFDE